MIYMSAYTYFAFTLKKMEYDFIFNFLTWSFKKAIPVIKHISKTNTFYILVLQHLRFKKYMTILF